MTAQRPAPDQRNSAALLFVAASVWVVTALTGGRIVALLASPVWRDVARQVVTPVLLFAGLYVIARFGIRDLRALSSVGFVRRPSAKREFALGLALGWGIALLLMLPAALTRNLSTTAALDQAHLLELARSFAALCGFACSVQLVVAGLPARLLVRTVGATWMVISIMLLAFCLVLSGQAGAEGSLLFAVLTAALFTFAFLRTRAIWVSLGLHLGWALGLPLLFGAPSPYVPASTGLLRSEIGGPVWLTGGVAGPQSSALAPLILLAAVAVLFRITRNYAWDYTYQPVTGAGRPMDVPPPPAHLQEESRLEQPLVQIVGVASPVTSTLPTAPHEPLQ